MAKLLELTEPKSCSGGFRQDFRQLNVDGNCDRSNPFYMIIIDYSIILILLGSTKRGIWTRHVSD